MSRVSRVWMCFIKQSPLYTFWNYIYCTREWMEMCIRDRRRTIRKAVEDPISEALVDGRLGSQPAAVTLTAKDGKPVLEL